MGYFRKYLHYLLLAASLMGLPWVVAAQIDSVGTGKEKIHSLYAGFDYGSNLVYLGSTISDNLPYFTPSLTYGYKENLFFSLSASHVSTITPYVAFLSASASYNKTVNSWFDYSGGIAYFKTAQSLQQTLFSNFLQASITTGFDWNILYTRLSLSEVFSQTNSTYIQFRNSHYFQTGQIFKDKAFVSFDPNISLIVGTLVQIETTTGTTRLPFRKFRKFPYVTSTTTYSYAFGLIDTEFSLPVTLNFTKFSLQAESLYILPSHTSPDYTSPEGFALNITAYFKIF
jgi:hypothetical protein